jgi:Phosphoribosyl-ATP pyrophosphohydrolase
MKESPVQYLMDMSFRASSIAGQALEIQHESKLQQYSYIKEELKELYDAIATSDLVEQLDACCDLMVCTMGFMQKLRQQGANLDLAMTKTADNNLSKFPTERKVAEESVEFYRSKGKECTISFNPVYQRYVIRNSNGKYMKPKGFVENDLSSCFPKGYIDIKPTAL